MMELTKGRVIDLSVNRSKHHALRLRGVGPDSEHRKLYSLVDIIYRRMNDSGKPKTGWTEYDYDYSGYTLDTVRFANDWTDDDKAALAHWVLQKDQRRIIETARRRLIENQKQISIKHYSAPKHLYGGLQQRLSLLPLQRAQAKQWLATIYNFKKKGVGDEELQWTGIIRYLRQYLPDEFINKQDILNNLSYKNIHVELSSEQVWGSDGGLCFKEVALRMPHQSVYRATLKLDEDCLCILRYVDSVYNYRVGVVKTLGDNNHKGLNKHWFAFDSYGRAITNTVKLSSERNVKEGKINLFFENSVEAKFAADKHAREHAGITSGAKSHTKFDHLTLCGGYDYREWIISLPDFQRTFYGAHFYDHNILAHIRTTTRTDNKGREILFIEEVQSDWHQMGKRFGYDNSAWGRIADAPFKKDWAVLAAKLMLIQASQNGFAGIAWPHGKIQEMRYGCDLKSIKQYYDKQIPKSLNKLVKHFNCEVELTKINTRAPWLNLEKVQDKWRVADGEGKFKTKAKYNNRDEALAVLNRHCPIIDLDVPVLFINNALRKQISEKGLPMFGLAVQK